MFLLALPNLNKDSYSFGANDAKNDTNDAKNDANDAKNDANDAKNDAKNEANDAKNDANDAKNETPKTLEEQVVELIRDNNSISKIEMSKKTGKSKATIERMLKQSKVIARVGPKKGGHWEIVENNKG